MKKYIKRTSIIQKNFDDFNSYKFVFLIYISIYKIKNFTKHVIQNLLNCKYTFSCYRHSRLGMIKVIDYLTSANNFSQALATLRTVRSSNILPTIIIPQGRPSL